MWRFGLILFILLISCTGNNPKVKVERGVSLGLAQQRKATVSDVVYDLSLKIDTLNEVNPTGLTTITFNYLPDGEPLQIDFAGTDISSLAVNGREISDPVWTDGHIVIDPTYLQQGENSITIGTTAAGRALNRNPGYMYTLFVPNRAHSVFPCFDQPDMKASYNLRLTVNDRWKAVSNSPVVSSVSDPESGTRTITFGPTEPLSTYLFAFAAGEFGYREHTAADGRTIGAYYRETDPYRLAQLDEIFTQVENSLTILEDYTGIPYPFAKYDLVILPGFQFGGMEHTGATFYKDGSLFLDRNATGADYLARAKIIAHETSHMWFGDYVTMEWFDDVWTKEVFANYFAAMLTRRLLPEYDHDLEWLRVYQSAALDQDRSEGSTPIRQKLDNLRNAGLIYNNIIYNKSPIMMAKLAEMTGDEEFRAGIRQYLSDHAYGNATWDDLITALSAHSDKDIEEFSRVWVYEAGMPEICVTASPDGKLTARQSDPRGRGIVWPQSFDVILSDGKSTETVTVTFDGSTDTVVTETSLSGDSLLVIPTADGRVYGLVTAGPENLRRLMADALRPDGTVASLRPVGQLATLMMLNENYLAGNITTSDWLDWLASRIEHTKDPQMLSALTRYVGSVLTDLPAAGAAPAEERLLAIASSHPVGQARTLLLRKLIPAARSPQSAEALYDMWQTGSSPVLGTDDFNNMAFSLAILYPERADSIIAVQRGRNDSPDRLRKYDYISRAAVSDTLALDSLFESLHDPANRTVEPWTLSVISLLNHPARQPRSMKYITPALEMLPEIQATGDIFFPANWSASLLGSYRSKEAARLVDEFLDSNRNMNPLLLNKVRQGATRLMLKQR